MALAASVVLGAIPFLAVELLRSRLYVVVSVPTYLVFHNIAEFFSIMVSLSVFGVGWFSHEQSRDRHAVFLGCAFLGIGLMDFMHAMSFTGMPAFFTANAATKTSQFWIAVRLFGAAAFLASAFVLPGARSRWSSRGVVLATVLAVTGIVFTAVNYFPEHLPLTYDPATGLSPFKIYCEYVVIALLVAAVAAYLVRARRTGDALVPYYVSAFVLLAYSELVFTVFQSMFDTFNALGHVYKLGAFYLVYRAVFIASVRKPYLALAAGRLELEGQVRERLAAEDALRRLNRELRAISSCDQVVVRAADEQTLLADICRIICSEAGYPLAWVGYVEHDEGKTIRPVAWAGAETGYVQEARLTWADTERGRGPGGTAARTGKSACIQDFASEPGAAPWREGAARRGYRSSIALPLNGADANAFGILCIYSAEANAFVPDEVRLLEELAANLAFGVTVLRARIEHGRTVEQLRQSQKLEAIGRLAGGVAHDFNNLLTGIMGASDFLLRGLPEGTQLHRDAAEILEAAQRAGALTRQLLAFSRKQVLQPRVLDLNLVVKAMDRMLRRLIGEDIALLALTAPDLGNVRVDPGQIEQVIMNLVVNARDAMPRAGGSPSRPRTPTSGTRRP